MVVKSFATVPQQLVAGPRAVKLTASQPPLPGISAVSNPAATSNPLPSLGMSSQTGSYALTTNDQASVVAMTGASASPGLDVTSAIKGWWAIIRNDTSAVMPITPASSTIDGGASITIGIGESAYIWYNGTAYESLHYEPTLNAVTSISGGTF